MRNELEEGGDCLGSCECILQHAAGEAMSRP